MGSRVGFIVALLIAVAGSTGRAQEWTRFRGPNGSGVGAATSIPVQWTEKDYLWKVELPGQGHSSPVLWGQKLYVTTCDAAGKRELVCINAIDGSQLWTKDFTGEAYTQNKLNSYASPSPAVDEERVYLTWATPEHYVLVALTLDGKDAWTQDLGGFKSQHGPGVSPMIVGDRVVLCDIQDGESSVAAFDRKSGKPAWRLPRRSGLACYATPIVYQPTPAFAPQLIVSSKSEGLASVDPATGRVLWEIPCFEQRPLGGALITGNGNLILAGCGTGGKGTSFSAIRPPALPGAAAGTPGDKPSTAYRLAPPNPIPYIPTPIVAGDLLIMPSEAGNILCVKAATGETVWNQKLKGGFFSSPVIANGVVYCVSTDGDVYAFKSAAKFELLGTTHLGEATQATPAIANDRMYLRTLTHLMCVGKK